MTLLADRDAPVPAPVAARRGRHRLRLRAHVAALAVVLLALVPLVGTGASFSADEGAAIVQAKSLSRGDGWIVGHPLPAVDPAGVSYPIENADYGAHGRAPYAKHPLYALLLAAADRIGGVGAMVALSLAGTVVAAGLAGLLARRLDPGLAVPTVWVVGLGSPLLFDGFLVMAHTLGAALAVAAVLLAVRALGRGRRRGAAVLALAPVVAAGVLLRTEFLFLAVGLALAVAVVGLARRRPAFPVLVAGTVVASAGVARLVERAWVSAILGLTRAPSGTAAAIPGGGMAERARGFVLTWLTTGYGGGRRPVDLALGAMLVAAALGAYLVRRRPQDRLAIVVVSVVAVLAATLAVVAGPTNVVPGLLVAFPLAAVGLVLVRRGTLVSTAARLSLATFALFSLAVVATQYQRGGSGEWGGRYFALGIPVVVPVLLLAMREAGHGLDRATRAAGALALAGCMVALSVMGLGSLRATHQRNTAMNRAIQVAAAAVPAGDGGRSVVVAADGALARHGWPMFDRARWLLAGSDLAGLADRLRAEGIDRFVVVTRDPAGTDLGLTVVSRQDGGGSGRRWSVLVVATP